MSEEVPHDGFCPHCGALDSQACCNPDGSARPDHKRRHPMPPAVPVGVQPAAEEAALRVERLSSAASAAEYAAAQVRKLAHEMHDHAVDLHKQKRDAAAAVPVVQPDDFAEAKSPGDRAACCEYHARLGIGDAPHCHECGEALDAEVAAAVAAVRADLAARVHELQPSRDHDAYLWGWQSALAAAAALIAGSS